MWLAFSALFIRLKACQRKARIRASFGFTRSSSGVPRSNIRPSSINTTWLATSLAKPISWVTISIVICSAASSLITCSTSPVSSGSSAEVGSSKHRISGSMASAGQSPHAGSGRRKVRRDRRLHDLPVLPFSADPLRPLPLFPLECGPRSLVPASGFPIH